MRVRLRVWGSVLEDVEKRLGLGLGLGIYISSRVRVTVRELGCKVSG